jgi:hypothetical protein
MRPVRKLKRTLKKEDSAQPLLQPMMMEEEEQGVPLEEPRGVSSAVPVSTAPSRQLVLTNVAWKSWIPRLSIGIGLMLGSLIILGLVSGIRCFLFCVSFC